MNYALIIIISLIALVVAWNVYPPFRAKMRGLSTIVEAIIGTGMTYFVMFADALKEARDAGYIPDNLETYVPIVLCAYIVIKRVQTKTPVRGK